MRDYMIICWWDRDSSHRSWARLARTQPVGLQDLAAASVALLDLRLSWTIDYIALLKEPLLLLEGLTGVSSACSLDDTSLELWIIEVYR